jgi:hypothetical protein
MICDHSPLFILLYDQDFQKHRQVRYIKKQLDLSIRNNLNHLVMWVTVRPVLTRLGRNDNWVARVVRMF